MWCEEEEVVGGGPWGWASAAATVVSRVVWWPWLDAPDADVAPLAALEEAP